MKVKKMLCLFLAFAMVVAALAACGGGNGDNGSSQAGGGQSAAGGGEEQAGGGEEQAGGGEEQAGSEEQGGAEVAADPFWMTLDPNVEGSIDIMCWSGDSIYHEDLGHWDANVDEDLTTMNVAMIYAMAKKFNERYPNVKINLYAMVDDGGGLTGWNQNMDNFRAEHGKYPDIYCSVMLPWDVSSGLVADLSVYADDPMYQSFNPSLMEMMNYKGVQAGLPQYALPWGVYVNKELAETNNIDVPDPDWDIDEYTDFITSANNSTFWGTIYGAAATQYIGTGTDTVNVAIEEGKDVDIASDQVMSLLEYIPQWATSEIWSLRNANEENVPTEVMDDGWWWSHRFFCRNYILTNNGDPWMLGSAVLGQNEDGTWGTNAVESNDWDIYPRPSTPYRGNNVGINIDPVCLRNYAMDDGDPALSDSEKAMMDVAYAFTTYWCGSTEAFQARADQMFNDAGTQKCSLNDSFPLVLGEEFDKQMEIWYQAGHERCADADLMPGFQYVVQLWQDGAIYDYSDKLRPVRIMVDGTATDCLYEWNNLTNAEVTGVAELDPNWLDTVKAQLPEWNKTINERLDQAQADLDAGLATYYGK